MGKRRLLIIDDHKHITELVYHVATEMGFETASTYGFRDVTAVYDGFKPDIVVLDIFMPDMDGFEVLRYLRNQTRCPNIIMLSGQSSYLALAEKMAKGLNLHIDATLQKPFRLEQLRQVLEDVSLRIKPAPSVSNDRYYSEPLSG